MCLARRLPHVFRFLSAAVVLLLGPLPGAQAQFLSDLDSYAGAWGEIAARLPDGAELMLLETSNERMTVIARASDGSGALDLYSARYSDTALAEGLMVEGPRRLAGAGNLPAFGFRLEEVPLIDRPGPVIATALAEAQAGPAGWAQVLWVRRLAEIGQPAGEVSFVVGVVTPRYGGQLVLDMDGKVTRRNLFDRGPQPIEPAPGAPANVATAATAALMDQLGADRPVLGVNARGETVEVVVVDPANPGQQWVYSYRNGRISTRSNSFPIQDGPGRSFLLGDSQLPTLPATVRAAQAALDFDPGPPYEARARRSGLGADGPVVWTVVLRPLDQPFRDFETEVTVSPDGAVQRVLLPVAMRPPWRGDGGAVLAEALADFVATFGPDARVWEIDARPDRVSLMYPDPGSPGRAGELTVTETGTRQRPGRPLMMMQTEDDLFALSVIARLKPEMIDAARAAGLAAVNIPGGELERLRLWSGAPFWRHPAGEPFFDIRVSAPNGANGYAVVTLDGQVVQAFR